MILNTYICMYMYHVEKLINCNFDKTRTMIENTVFLLEFAYNNCLF